MIAQVPALGESQTAIINHLSANDPSNKIIIAPSGIGKTTAAIINMMRNIDVNKKDLQAFFLTINFDAAFQALQFASHLCPNLKMQLVTNETTALQTDAQCIFGTSMEVHSRFELFSNAITGAHTQIQMYFDDADMTMTTNIVKTNMLEHKAYTRFHCITTFAVKDIDALSPVRKFTINFDKNSVHKKFHYGFVQQASHLATLVEICEFQMQTKHGIVIICKVFIHSTYNIIY